MFFTTKQKFILETLRSLGCVRRRQLHALVWGRFQEGNFEITTASMDAMLRQIRVGTTDVRMDDELVWQSGHDLDCRCLEAIDVMIELTGGKAQDFSTKTGSSCLLRFSFGRGSGLKLFTVVSMDIPPVELAVQAKERVIWLSDRGEAPKGLTLPPKHFFAARLPDGSHRFYGSNGP